MVQSPAQKSDIPFPAMQVSHLHELERTGIDRGPHEVCRFDKCIGIKFIDLPETGSGFKKGTDKFIVLLPRIQDRDIPLIGSVMGNPKKTFHRLVCSQEIFRIGNQFPELYAMIAGLGNYMANIPGEDVFGDPIWVCGT
jgi:hypothetical protein